MRRCEGEPERTSAQTVGRLLDHALDACGLLDADHVAVELLFAEYRVLTRSCKRQAVKKRAELAREIGLALTIQARLELEAFYPALRAVLSVAEVLAEAQARHECAHYLLARIQQAGVVDIAFDALVKTLSLHVALHMQAERTALFPVVRASRRLDQPLLLRTLEDRRAAIHLEESDRVVAHMQLQAKEKATQRVSTLQKIRAAAKTRKSRGGAVVTYTLSLSDAR